jgi:hypothetical protein
MASLARLQGLLRGFHTSQDYLDCLESLPFIRYEAARLRPKKRSTESGSTLSLLLTILIFLNFCERVSSSGRLLESEFNLGSL